MNNELSKKVTLDGNIVKRELNQHQQNNYFLADIWGYSDRKSVSKYISNKKEPIDIDRALKLANTWGVRLEYLMGESEYRTEKDLRESMTISNKKSFVAGIEFIESLGYGVRIIERKLGYNEPIMPSNTSLKDLSLTSSIPHIQADKLVEVEFSKNGKPIHYASIEDTQIFIRGLQKTSKAILESFLPTIEHF